MKMIPIDVLYRLYKARDGETIDNTYTRLSGDFNSELIAPNVNEKGQVSIAMMYELRFKGPGNELFYSFYGTRKVSGVGKYEDDYLCEEPFIHPYRDEGDYPAYHCQSYKRMVTVMTRIDEDCTTG